MERLQKSAASGQAGKLYRQFHRRGDASRPPNDPLLYVPSHPARALDLDLEAAGIKKKTAEGKIDFHACRLAYINLVIDSGVSVKQEQELARHSAADMTMNVYGRANVDRLAEAVERVGRAFLQPEGVPEEYRGSEWAETRTAQPTENQWVAPI